MFNNPGGKIKSIANFLCALCISASIIAGGTIIINTNNRAQIFMGIAIIVLGSIVSWISFLLMYAFGQLVENSDRTVEFYKNRSYDFTPTTADNTSIKFKAEWKCEKCGALVSAEYDNCPYCHEDTEQTQTPKNLRQKLTDLMFEPVDSEEEV